MTDQRFPGRPDDVFRASRELERQSGRLQSHARSTSTAGAQAARGWRGSASVAHASRNGQHVKSAATGAQTLGQASRDAAAFGRELERIQRLGGTAITRHAQHQRDLAILLRQRPAALAAEPGSAATYDREVNRLRRAVAYQEGIINGLQRDLLRLQQGFHNSLLALIPPEVYQWWLLAKEGKTGLDGARTVLKQGTATAAFVQAVKQHKAAVAAGNPAAAAKALRVMVDARKTLLPPGDIDDARRAARRVANSPRAGRVATSSPVRAVANNPLIKAVRSGPIATVGRKVILPVGVADTMWSGGKDVVTGGGHDGARGVVTRVTGGGAFIGAPLLFTPAAPVGAVLVGGWLLWKGGGALWDRRESVKRIFRREPLKLESTVKGLPPPARQPVPPPPPRPAVTNLRDLVLKERTGDPFDTTPRPLREGVMGPPMVVAP